MESDLNESAIKERVIPVESIQLMFHYKKPFLVCHSDGKESRQPLSLIGGLSDSFFDAKTNGETGVIFVYFNPAGACYFFDFPLIEIRNRIIALSDIYHHEINRVEELLQRKKSSKEKIEIVEQFLVKRFTSIPEYNYKLVKTAVDNIKQHKGQISASELAQKLSVTKKTLERKFSEYIGFTPKRFASLIRFQNILLDINNKASLTECSFNHGYFDQSHFIKDFKMFSGYTPREYTEIMAGCNNISIDFSPE
jgi:AraC-like DNA-binding protein